MVLITDVKSSGPSNVARLYKLLYFSILTDNEYLNGELEIFHVYTYN